MCKRPNDEDFGFPIVEPEAVFSGMFEYLDP